VSEQERLRVIEALHRARWPNESSDYDPARDNECAADVEVVRDALAATEAPPSSPGGPEEKP
jgi:hypothetical protein